MKIGVLAVQGGFAEHIAAIRALGASAQEIRKAADLKSNFDGLIFPGGESTVMGKVLRETGMFRPLQELIADGLPAFGTCAGMIMLADQIENEPYAYLGGIDIAVRRNAYGRQLGSFSTDGLFSGIGMIPMTFIRAPYIAAMGNGVTPLAWVDGHPVAAENAQILVTAFHPELTADLRVHRYFLHKIEHQGLTLAAKAVL